MSKLKNSINSLYNLTIQQAPKSLQLTDDGTKKIISLAPVKPETIL
jgi:hypothetical protein